MSKITIALATSHSLSLAAMEEASRQGLRDADIEHLFLALVISEQAAGQVLRGLGITLADARGAIAAQHAEQLGALGIAAAPEPGRIVFHETQGYEWTERALGVIGRASSSGNAGDATAVLRELLAEPSGLIEALLVRLDATSEGVLSRLEDASRIPSHAPKESRPPLTGITESFVPASPADVWALISDPLRIPEWDAVIGSIEPGDGDAWEALARSAYADGTPLKTKPQFCRQRVELVSLDESHLVAWRFTYPDAPRSNSRRVEISLESAAGGTQLRITFAWEVNPARRRRFVRGSLLRPLHRFAIWVQATQVAASISRAFRN